MGVLSYLQKLRKDKSELRVCCFGLDGAGKTTIVRALLDEEITGITPTQGYNIKTFVQDNVKLTVWDVGGQKSLRGYWKNYFVDTNALIYVVDCSDNVRLEESSSVLNDLLEEEKLAGVPLLVLANKQDLANRMTAAEISEVMNLNNIRDRSWIIKGCSAKKGEGLHKAIGWLISENFP